MAKLWAVDGVVSSMRLSVLASQMGPKLPPRPVRVGDAVWHPETRTAWTIGNRKELELLLEHVDGWTHADGSPILGPNGGE